MPFYCLLPPSPVITCQAVGHSSRPAQKLLLHKAILDSAALPPESVGQSLLVPLSYSVYLYLLLQLIVLISFGGLELKIHEVRTVAREQFE